MIIVGPSHQRQPQQQQHKVPKMAADNVSLKFACGLGLVFLLASLADLNQVVECQEQLNANSVAINRQKDSENELSDTIKYLEKLETIDKYWSEVARPRFGRSKFKQATEERFVTSNGQPQQQRYGSLVDLINARLAHKYNSNY